MPKKRGAPESRTPSSKRVCAETSQVVEQIPANPACPFVVKTRPQGSLSKLQPGSDIFEAFAKLRTDKNLTDEEAFLEFLATYDVPLKWLSRVTGNLTP